MALNGSAARLKRIKGNTWVSNKLTWIFWSCIILERMCISWNSDLCGQIIKKEEPAHENDISAKEEAAQKGARLQKKNEDKEWQKCTEEKKKKRKKSFISIETAQQWSFCC